MGISGVFRSEGFAAGGPRPTGSGFPQGDAGEHGQDYGSSDVQEKFFCGLGRLHAGIVPRAGDPSCCTPSMCSERCLAQAIVAYWATLGLEARVSLRDGFPRLAGQHGISPPA
jgi:hypothetical protein